PLMVAVQIICARIGLVSGAGLTGALRKRYPRGVLLLICILLAGANVFNIAADLAGMADAASLIIGLPVWICIPLFAVTVVVFTVVCRYETFSRYVKWSTLTLFAYVAAAILSRPHWPELLVATVAVPLHWSRPYFTTIVAILGTTISPYLFFWQASAEV